MAFRFVPAFVTVAVAIAAAHADISITAIDEGGAPARGAVALVAMGDRSFKVVPLDEDGTGAHNVQDFVAAKSATVLVAAPGRVTVRQHLDGDFRNAAVAATMLRGMEAKFRIRTASGVPLPDDAVVMSYDSDSAGWAWWSQLDGAPGDFSLYMPERIAPDLFVFNVPADCPPLYVGVHAPGALRGWGSAVAYPVAASAGSAETTINLPSPGGVEAVFAGKEGSAPRSYYGILEAALRAGGNPFVVAIDSRDTASGTEVAITASDLAPGMYKFVGGTGTAKHRWDDSRADSYSDSASVAVFSNGAEKVRLVHKPLDLSSLKGDHDVTIKLKTQTGEPARDLAWKLTTRVPKAGEVEVAAGKTGSDGIVELKGLVGGGNPRQYNLVRGGERIDAIVLKGSAKSRTIEMLLPPTVGDAAPDVALTDMATGKTFRLADLKGQVVFLDFWATWCGPCQEPMQHNSEIVARRGKEWDGKAVILAASCDDELATLKKHVATKGWGNVHQAWCQEGGAGWGSKPMRAFGISGVPTAFLIGKDGKIAWRGHPGSADVEGMIDRQLQ